jgi:hypothetical protein
VLSSSPAGNLGHQHEAYKVGDPDGGPYDAAGAAAAAAQTASSIELVPAVPCGNGSCSLDNHGQRLDYADVLMEDDGQLFGATWSLQKLQSLLQ